MEKYLPVHQSCYKPSSLSHYEFDNRIMTAYPINMELGCANDYRHTSMTFNGHMHSKYVSEVIRDCHGSIIYKVKMSRDVNQKMWMQNIYGNDYLVSVYITDHQDMPIAYSDDLMNINTLQLKDAKNMKIVANININNTKWSIDVNPLHEINDIRLLGTLAGEKYAIMYMSICESENVISYVFVWICSSAIILFLLINILIMS